MLPFNRHRSQMGQRHRNEPLPARILVAPLNINDLRAGGEKMQRKLGLLRRNPVCLPSHASEDRPDLDRHAKSHENDYWESEF